MKIKGIKKISKKELLELRDMASDKLHEWCDFLNLIDKELHRRINNMNAKELRKRILINSFKAGACHLGSSLSCVEILIAINDVKKKNDVFLFSKASGVAAYYALLNRSWIDLKKYPLPSKEGGCIHSVGSLGHGLSVACGMAYADRKNKVYCLISDAELNEGSTWEAILFAGHHKLDNLIAVVDNNKIQACGKTVDVLDNEPLQAKFKAFNWCVSRCDGHNIEYIKDCLTRWSKKPKMIVADTCKGKGIDFLENKVESHYVNLNQSTLKRALEQIK
jgi:transketolase